MKEDQDFKVLDDATWQVLFKHYGGKDVPRMSVTLQTEDPSKPDYAVELQLRKFKIATHPRVRYLKGITSEPYTIYVSRAATVRELHAQISYYCAK